MWSFPKWNTLPRSYSFSAGIDFRRHNLRLKSIPILKVLKLNKHRRQLANIDVPVNFPVSEGDKSWFIFAPVSVLMFFKNYDISTSF